MLQYLEKCTYGSVDFLNLANMYTTLRCILHSTEFIRYNIIDGVTGRPETMCPRPNVLGSLVPQ